MEELVGSLQCEHGILGVLGNHDFIEKPCFDFVAINNSSGLRKLRTVENFKGGNKCA
jgi:hypothetical protein